MTGIPRYVRALTAGCAFALTQGCDTSVRVDNLPSNSDVSKSVPMVPGTTDPVPEPTMIDNKTCSEEANANVTLNFYNTLERWPSGGDQFVIFWTVCNSGKQAQAAGSSYDFVLQVESVDTQSPTPPTFAAFSTTPIPIPALAACACYTQEVGIGMAVDSAVPQQPSIQGLGAQFPQLNPPANAPKQGNIVQEYVATLSSSAGLSAPNSLTFEIN